MNTRKHDTKCWSKCGKIVLSVKLCDCELCPSKAEKIIIYETKIPRQKHKNSLLKFIERMSVNIRDRFSRPDNNKSNETFKLLGYTPQNLRDYLDKWVDKPCEICGCEYDKSFHIDHIIPKSIGKTEEQIIKLNQLENLRLICGKCNMKKGVKY